MQLHISTSDGLPIYLQVASQIKYLAASGRLAPGDEIPPIRALARQLCARDELTALDLPLELAVDPQVVRSALFEDVHREL